jgi:hypothetical protein
MATRTELKELPKRRSGRGRAPRHDWDSWFDGAVWRLVQGEDFTSKMSSFRAQISFAGRARGKRVEVRNVEDAEGEILVQAFRNGS